MIADLPDLRDRVGIFRDRGQAGRVLARMLEGKLPPGARLLAIPAGGVPVAAAMARALRLPLDVAVVSKITPSWNTEVGYGAVAFDGRIRLDEEMAEALGIDGAEARAGTERTAARVRRRVERLRGGRGALVAPGDTVVLVDDGLASGFTMLTAIDAVRDAGASRVLVAVPTGSRRAVERVSRSADEVHCANVRGGARFAVADAYQEWSDVDDATLVAILDAARPARDAHRG
jgi:predicted phosphoribosyltransferase